MPEGERKITLESVANTSKQSEDLNLELAFTAQASGFVARPDFISELCRKSSPARQGLSPLSLGRSSGGRRELGFPFLARVAFGLL